MSPWQPSCGHAMCVGSVRCLFTGEQASERPWGRPLRGPIQEPPRGVGLTEAQTMLSSSVHGLDLGDYDRRILSWMSTWDCTTVATVASLISRANTGPADAVVTRLRTELINLFADVERSLDNPETDRTGALERVADRLADLCEPVIDPDPPKRLPTPGGPTAGEDKS